MAKPARRKKGKTANNGHIDSATDILRPAAISETLTPSNPVNTPNIPLDARTMWNSIIELAQKEGRNDLVEEFRRRSTEPLPQADGSRPALNNAPPVAADSNHKPKPTIPSAQAIQKASLLAREGLGYLQAGRLPCLFVASVIRRMCSFIWSGNRHSQDITFPGPSPNYGSKPKSWPVAGYSKSRKPARWCFRKSTKPFANSLNCPPVPSQSSSWLKKLWNSCFVAPIPGFNLCSAQLSPRANQSWHYPIPITAAIFWSASSKRSERL